jgi:putative flippase GtrA
MGGRECRKHGVRGMYCTIRRRLANGNWTKRAMEAWRRRQVWSTLFRRALSRVSMVKLSAGWQAVIPASRPARYVAVVALGWVADSTTFLLLRAVASIPLALLAARAVGALTGYFGHRLLTFAHRRRPKVLEARAFAGYVLLWGVNYLVVAFGVSRLASGTRMSELAVKTGIEVVLLAVNYVVLRHAIFARTSDDPGIGATSIESARPK